MGTFRVEPSAVVKGNIWVSIKENFFCHVLLKYMVLTRATWLSGDPALSNGMPCTSPSAQERGGKGDTCHPTHPGLKTMSVWVDKASWDCSLFLRARGTTHKALLNPLTSPPHLYVDLIEVGLWSMLSSELSLSWSMLRAKVVPGVCYSLNSMDDSSPVLSTTSWS